MVSADLSIDKKYRRRLRLMTWALSSVPRGLLLAARKITGIPLVARLIVA
jgi:hypothetical protein